MHILGEVQVHFAHLPLLQVLRARGSWARKIMGFS